MKYLIAIVLACILVGCSCSKATDEQPKPRFAIVYHQSLGGDLLRVYYDTETYRRYLAISGCGLVELK